VFMNHVLVSGVVSALVLLAGRKSKTESIGIVRRRRLCSTDRTFGRSRAEAIPVPAIRIEPRDVDVNGMPEIGRRLSVSAPDNLLHPFIGRNLPYHGLAPALPVTLCLWIRNQASPEHNAVACGIAGGDASHKGIRRELR